MIWRSKEYFEKFERKTLSYLILFCINQQKLLRFRQYKKNFRLQKGTKIDEFHNILGIISIKKLLYISGDLDRI